MSSNNYPYDLEVLPNVFTMHIRMPGVGKRTFQISELKNELPKILSLIEKMQVSRARMVGFNNVDYDYPVLHYLLTELRDETDWRTITKKLKAHSDKVIKASNERNHSYRVPDYKRFVTQIDLRLIHHFDNKNRMVSLKELEFNMMMDDIREFECSFSEDLPKDKIPSLIGYNDHDGLATEMFLGHSEKDIKLREEMGAKYNKNMLNYNNGKIGNQIFVTQLERKLGREICYYKKGKERKVRKTERSQIDLGEILFDYIQFKTPAFVAVKDWFKEQTIKETKGVFSELPLEKIKPILPYHPLWTARPAVQEWCKGEVDKEPRTPKKLRNLAVVVDGVEIAFGLGGIHGSVKESVFRSDDEYCILDIDVKSYYPAIGIENGLYPEHLGPEFIPIYKEIRNLRFQYEKGTSENKAFKEALNIPYGNSNSRFSPFYDPKYTMTVTVNGQLSLCMLYEWLRPIDSLTLIQMNTDGMTFKIKRADVEKAKKICQRWEKLTKYTLEYAEYDLMHVRDVNNYIARYTDGSIKRKGKYAFIRPNEEGAELGWHQNHSALVVPKAASAYVLEGKPVEHTIFENDFIYDFMLRAKLQRSYKLMLETANGAEKQQNLTRYFVSTNGGELKKHMPPLEKDPDKWRVQSINAGMKVQVCNNVNDFDWQNVNYQWYIDEAYKLINFQGEYDD